MNSGSELEHRISSQYALRCNSHGQKDEGAECVHCLQSSSFLHLCFTPLGALDFFDGHFSVFSDNFCGNDQWANRTS